MVFGIIICSIYRGFELQRFELKMFYSKWISEKKREKKEREKYVSKIFEKFYYTEFHTLSLSYRDVFLVDHHW